MVVAGAVGGAGVGCGFCVGCCELNANGNNKSAAKSEVLLSI